MTQIAHPELEGLGKYEYGWSDKDDKGANAERGLPHYKQGKIIKESKIL